MALAWNRKECAANCSEGAPIAITVRKRMKTDTQLWTEGRGGHLCGQKEPVNALNEHQAIPLKLSMDKEG